MSYYLLQDSQAIGPYTLEQLKEFWKLGQIIETTLHCQEGCTEWLPLSVLRQELEPSPLPPPLPTVPPPSLPGAAPAHSWVHDCATEKQIQKLRWFGCSWSGPLTKGQASQMLDDCARKFPDRDAEWYARPATATQRKELRELDSDSADEPDLTYREAKEWLEEFGEERAMVAAIDDADAILRERESDDDEWWQSTANACFKLYPWLDYEGFLKVFAHVRGKTHQEVTLEDILAGVKEVFPERFS